MAHIANIAFSKLTAPEALNARPATRQDLDELAASIAAKGLIQPLAVRPADASEGRYEVIDGRRRFLALQILVKSKAMSKSDMVPVMIREEDDAEALETSLVANTQRLPMHPVDQYGVFTRLEAQGHSAADLASRFGVNVKTVRQRLALGRLAPTVLKSWRDGKIDEKCAQAFTLAVSHEAQEAAFAQLKRHGVGEHAVRRLLTAERPSAARIPAAVVDAYLAAGGTITESLFEEQRLIDDPAIFRQVATVGIEPKRQELLDQGWSWVDLASEMPNRNWQYQWQNVSGVSTFEPPDYTEAEAARREAINELLEDLEWEDPQVGALEAEGAAIESTAEQRRYTPEMRARAGVVIDDRDPLDISFAFGLVRPDDAGQADIEDSITKATRDHFDDAVEGAGVGGDPETDDDVGATISGALLETITTSQTDAAREALLVSPVMALRFTVAGLRSRIWTSPVKLRIDVDRSMPQPEHGEFDQELAKISSATVDDLINALADLVATSLDLVSHNTAAQRDGVELLVDHLRPDAYLAAARKHFLAEDYFKRASKAVAFEALDDMAEAGAVPSARVEALADAKKAAVAEVAARTAQACGWLPPELRHSAYTIITTSKDEAA